MLALNKFFRLCSLNKPTALCTKPRSISFYDSPFLVDHQNTKIKFETSTSPEEWSYVERALPPTIVPAPVPKDRYPSQWKPQTDDVKDRPYFVPRTKNHMLPVYLCLGQRGIRRVTKVRNVQGDIWLLEKQLRDFIQPQDIRPIRSQVNEFARYIRFHGDYVNAIKYWLMKQNL
ncbi:hypothetical protein PPYR_07411 [Photinus pyralis]|uniref:Large ribosomal subunit protein mL49 n=2 Tax=Photinus pyralis TaxID=7054 RepID=A0A5N4AQE6_PHOPY|nr:probable 39S ribosomal protein L49, mitochondrial [Photinus pyralis]KAB0799531.1 hypothetical protein PPYR_07411 [Photinus pyralis]